MSGLWGQRVIALSEGSAKGDPEVTFPADEPAEDRVRLLATAWNIGEGLLRGYQQASTRGIPDDAVRVVLLLSDGRANVGIVAQDKLSHLALDAFQKGIQTSAFGLGQDYDGGTKAWIRWPDGADDIVPGSRVQRGG